MKRLVMAVLAVALSGCVARSRPYYYPDDRRIEHERHEERREERREEEHREERHEEEHRP